MTLDTAEQFFSAEEENDVVSAIRMAEKATSGEIRVHIEEGDDAVEVLDRAQQVFHLLQMDRTALQNGVLLYLDIRHRRFAIWGGQGIYEVVPHGFWDDAYALAADCFKRGEFAQGLCRAIAHVGEKLKENFPYQPGDVNELSDEISKGRV